MALIETTDFESVRKLIDITLTVGQLPDAVINLTDYIGEAIRRVQLQTSNEDVHTKRAARAYLAALLIPALPRLLKEANAGYSYEREKTDWEARIAQLEAIAGEAIADSETENPSETGDAWRKMNYFGFFTVAESKLSDDWWA